MAAKRKSDKTPVEDRRKTSRVLAAEAQGQDKPENWADKPDSEAYLAAVKLYEKVEKAFKNKEGQEDQIEEYWSIFNAQPDDNRSYIGNSTCYLPEVRNCIKARAKRALKQLFPVSRRHVEALSADDQKPYALLALMEHYIRATRLKNVVRADLIAGDVTGQWCLYVDWISATRKVRKAIRSPEILEDDSGAQVAELETEAANDSDGPTHELRDDEMVSERPDVLPIAVQDLAVIPPTANRLEPGVTTVVRMRMTKDRVQEMVREGVFVGQDADDILESLGTGPKALDRKGGKNRTRDVGVKTEGTFKHALVFVAHTELPLGDDEDARESAFVYYCGGQIIGIIRNPWWSGKSPIISASLEEVEGSFFGLSPVEPVKFMQWNMNDLFNQGLDSTTYALLPIVMTDPVKNPNYNSMVMGLAAIWLADPNSTKFASFPPLLKENMGIISVLQQQIRESMDVNDSMLGRAPQGRKGSQQVAKQAADEATNISDLADRYEETMLNPLMELFFELDQQFRTRSLTVEQKGDIGVRAKLMEIPPQQFDERFMFRWVGSDYANGMQRVQQQIAALNVLRGIPPQMMNGRRLDVTPALESLVEVLFGPEVAPHILIDERNLYTVDPEIENGMLHNGFPVEVHAADDDVRHVQAHQMAAMRTGDQSGFYRAHMTLHMKQLQQKRQAQQAQPGGMPGVPGGAGPGVAGTPRIGAQPGQPRMQQPAGAVHQDQMADPAVAARA